MRKQFRLCIALILVQLPLTGSAYDDFGVTEKSGNYISGNAQINLYDSSSVKLENFIDKPTLISFIDFRCRSYCPRLMDGISELFTLNKLIPDFDYKVLTLRLNQTEEKDDSDNMAQVIHKLKKYKGWYFAEADSNTIRQISESLGYYFMDHKNIYIHPVVTILVTPKGKISQYFYGYNFNIMHFDMSVEEAKNEKVSTPRIRTLKYCNQHGPKKNPLVKEILFSWGGILLGIIIFLFIILIIRRQR